MIASLYICDKSFVYNGTDSDAAIVRKMNDFCDLIEHTQCEQFKKDNKLYLNNNQFWTTKISKQLIMSELFDISKRPAVFRDVLNRLQQGLQICNPIRICNNESLLEFLEFEDGGSACAIIVFNKQNDLPNNKQIFSTIEGWREFRRAHLLKYPHDVPYFLNEAKCVFPDLVINPKTANFMTEIYESHFQKIVTCLSYLNNQIRDELKNFKGGRQAFIDAPKPYGMKCSNEGTSLPKFYIPFVCNGETKIAYCEPHLKYNCDDFGHKQRVMRVYFELPNCDDKKVYVGYIRKHI